MIIDAMGTEIRGQALRFSQEWKRDRNRPLQWWTPQGDRTHYKIVVCSRSGLILWQRPFETLIEAFEARKRFLAGDRFDCPSFDGFVTCDVWTVVLFLAVGDHVWSCPDGVTPLDRLPLLFPPGDPNHDPDMWDATSGSFTSSNSTLADWFTGNRAPTGVSQTDYLVVAGGGSGGSSTGPPNGGSGGGGAGGMKTSTALAVTAGTQYTVTVGAGGTGVTNADGNAGSNSVFSSITATGGGKGGSWRGGGVGNAGGSGGSGGGGASFAPGAGGAGNAGEGNNGGTGASGGNGAGGGGGSGSVGAAGSGGNGGNGGTGTSSSMTGSPVTYASGGGGGCFNATAGTASAGGGTAGSVGSANATAAAANTGGGSGGTGGGSTGAGGSGIVGLTYTAGATASKVVFNAPMLGM